jgi:uncharacterized protein (TIGR04141 family)
MDRPPTRLVTLNHLVGLRSVPDAVQAIAVDDTDHDGPDKMRVTADHLPVGGCDALWFTFQAEPDDAPWAQDAEIMLGRPVDVREQRSGGVLVIDVDGRLYAISFGQGFRRIQDGYRDQRFGLRVAIRCLDGAELSEIVRRRPGTGRIDSTITPGGAPVLWLRPGNLSEIVRRIGGRTLPMALTYQPAGDRAAKLLGSSGLRLRLGLRGEDLVRDIRTIAGIHDRPLPLMDLAFVDDVAPVSDARTRRQLDADLEDMLTTDPGEMGDLAASLAVSVPDSALDHLDEAMSYRISIDRVVRAVPDITLDDIAAAVRDVPPGRRLAALTEGQIAPCELPGGRRMLARPAAVKWIEATIVIGDRHFVLLDGEWHEFDRDFATRVKREVDDVFRDTAAIDLPGWPAGWDEARYNRHVAQVDPRYLCLDRKLVRDRELHHGPGLELCDLLGPENELIHVKHAKGSSTLSHLFAQGLVSWLSLRGTETRRRFRTLVRDVSGVDRLPDDYVPSRVVFAILLGNGRPLTPQTLFPFAQAALAHTATELRERQVRLDVVGITPLPTP